MTQVPDNIQTRHQSSVETLETDIFNLERTAEIAADLVRNE